MFVTLCLIVCHTPFLYISTSQLNIWCLYKPLYLRPNSCLGVNCGSLEDKPTISGLYKLTKDCLWIQSQIFYLLCRKSSFVKIIEPRSFTGQRVASLPRMPLERYNTTCVLTSYLPKFRPQKHGGGFETETWCPPPEQRGFVSCVLIASKE